MPKLAEAYVEIIAKTGKYKANINETKRITNEFGANVTRTLRRVGAVFTGLGATITASLAGMITHATKAGDEFHKMSLRTGESAARLSALKHAADISGTSMQEIETGLRRLSQNMNDFQNGVGEAKDTFDALGITVVDVDGNLRSSIDVMTDVADKLNEVESESQKVAYAQELFGRAGSRLLPLLKEGSIGIKALTDEAARLGLVIGDEAAAAAAEFNDRMTELKSSLRAASRQIGSALLPVLEPLVARLTEVIASVSKWIQEHPKLTSELGKFALVIGGLMTAGGPLLIMAPTIAKIIPILSAFRVQLTMTSASVAAFTASLWAAYRIYSAWQDKVDIGKIATRTLTERQKELSETIELMNILLDEYATRHDRASATMADIGISADDLTEKFGALITPSMKVTEVLAILARNLSGIERRFNKAAETTKTITEYTYDFAKAVGELNLHFLSFKNFMPYVSAKTYDFAKAVGTLNTQIFALKGFAPFRVGAKQFEKFGESIAAAFRKSNYGMSESAKKMWKNYYDNIQMQADRSMSGIKDAFQNMFENLLSGETKGLWEQFWDDLKRIAIRKMAEMAASEAMFAIFGKAAGAGAAGAGGGGAGFLSSLGTGGLAALGTALAPAGAILGGGVAIDYLGNQIGGTTPSGNTYVFNEVDLANMDRNRLSRDVSQQMMGVQKELADNGK